MFDSLQQSTLAPVLRKLSSKLTTLKRNSFLFYSAGAKFVNKEDLRDAENFLNYLGKNRDQRRELARELARELDLGQSPYADIQFDSTNQSFKLAPDFRLAFGYRPIDKLLSLILDPIDSIIGSSSLIVKRRKELSPNQNFERHAIDLEKRHLDVARELVEFVGALAAESLSVAGIHRALASLVNASKAVNLGLNNPNPSAFQAEFGNRLDTLIKASDNAPVRDHKVFDYALDNKENRDLRGHNQKRAEAFGKAGLTHAPRTPANISGGGYYSVRANCTGGIRKVSPRIGMTREPNYYTEVPEPFAATFASTGLINSFRELGKDRAKEALGSLLDKYDQLDKASEASLKTRWEATKADFLQAARDSDRWANLFEPKPDQLTPLEFIVAEAHFNASDDFNLASLRALIQGSQKSTETFTITDTANRFGKKLAPFLVKV